MGRAKRVIPQKLGKKLSAIREGSGLTLEEFIERLNCPEIPLYPASISLYEDGKREPPLIVLLRYARLAKTSIDVLVDDELEFPEKTINRN